MRLAIDTSDVPEEFRDAKFEEELLQFQCALRVNTSSPRWLFGLALHEGAHWRYGSGERTLRGPHIQYRDGDLKLAYGSIESQPEKSSEFEFIADTWKEWLAGPLAVSVLTGAPADAEPDILAACKYLEIPREKAESWITLAKIDLWSELRDPVIVGEILDAARKYARAIFHDESCVNGIKKNGKPCGTASDYHGDFCVDWGIRKYRIGTARANGTRESVIVSA